MTADEFWHGKPELAVAYRKAYKIRKRNALIQEWRQGVYVYEALLSASPAFREISKGIKHDYPSKPLFDVELEEHVSEEAANKAKMEEQKAKFTAMMEAVNRKFA